MEPPITLKKKGPQVTRFAKISEQQAEETVVDLIRKGTTQVVVNTMDKDRQNATEDGFIIRREAVEHGVPTFANYSGCDSK